MHICSIKMYYNASYVYDLLTPNQKQKPKIKIILKFNTETLKINVVINKSD